MKNWTPGAVAGLLLDVLFALLGPACAAFYLAGMWAARNDLASWERQGGYFCTVSAILVCLIPVTAAYLFGRRLFKPRPSRWTKFIVASLAGSFLVQVLWFTGGAGIYLSRDINLRAEKAEADKLTIDRRRLAEECIQILGKANVYAGREPKREELPPLIASMMPTYVDVQLDRLRIELIGGFDHHGYDFWKDEKKKCWVLEWYEEGGAEVLLKMPLTTAPRHADK